MSIKEIKYAKEMEKKYQMQLKDVVSSEKPATEGFPVPFSVTPKMVLISKEPGFKPGPGSAGK